MDDRVPLSLSLIDSNHHSLIDDHRFKIDQTNMYWIAGPSEVLAITGCGIDDIKLSKKKWIWPGQKCIRVDISPVNYTFEVQAMSAEKLPFILPAVFTIGPRVDNEESMLKYAKLISPHHKFSNHVKELVQGVIEGETRVLAASMTMEQIFKGTKEFKKEVFDKVQLELDQFGLHIYNPNVKQLVDVQGHEYFSYLGQKTQMEAANQARIDVAEAKMKGEIGSKQREGQTTQNAAKIDAEMKIVATKRQGEGKKEEVRVRSEVQIFENQRQAEVAEANAELATKKAGWAQLAQLAEVEAAKAVALREAELQRAVEEKNALTQKEKLKAEKLSKASVDYEIKLLMKSVIKLGLGEDFLQNAFGGDNIGDCDNFYPECPQPDPTFGLSSHSDPGGMTLLLPDGHVAGLQVRKNNQWITVKPAPHAFIVNIGDQLQRVAEARRVAAALVEASLLDEHQAAGLIPRVLGVKSWTVVEAFVVSENPAQRKRRRCEESSQPQLLMICFSDEDLQGKPPRQGPLVIMVTMDNCLVDMSFVDTGSFYNIMYLASVKKLGFEAKLVQSTLDVCLVGFNGKEETPEWMVTLSVKAGSKTVDTKFLVIDAPSSYNVILGTWWIHEMKAVASTYHGLLKFPNLDGTAIEEIRGDEVA